MTTFKNVVRTTFTADLISSIGWGLLAPYTVVLKGLLTIPTITLLGIIAALSIEFLPRLSKKASLANVWVIRRVYDLISIILITVVFIYGDEKEFIFAFLVIAIPFTLLMGAENNKHNATLARIYKHGQIEKIGVFQRVWIVRFSIIVMAIAGVSTSIGMPNHYLVYGWIMFITIELSYSVYAYNKYVRYNPICAK
jgi:hypothetical protein